MEEKAGKLIAETTYFRLPDLMTIASEEGQHAITDSSEFELTLIGIILDYDEIVICECNYPNHGEDETCVACEESLDGLKRMRFWRLVPNMQEVNLEVRPLSLGPPELDES